MRVALRVGRSDGFHFFTFFLPGKPSTISLTEKNSCCSQSTPLVPLLHLRNNNFYFQCLELIEAMGKGQCFRKGTTTVPWCQAELGGLGGSLQSREGSAFDELWAL